VLSASGSIKHRFPDDRECSLSPGQYDIGSPNPVRRCLISFHHPPHLSIFQTHSVSNTHNIYKSHHIQNIHTSNSIPPIRSIMISLFTLLVLLVAALSTAAPLPDDLQAPSIVFKRVNPIPPSVTCGRTYPAIESHISDSTNKHQVLVNPSAQTNAQRVYQRDEIAAGMSAIDDYKNRLPDPSHPQTREGLTNVRSILFDSQGSAY
jgi:hypothetical protein